MVLPRKTCLCSDSKIYISIILYQKAGGAGSVINGSPILNGKSPNSSLGKSTATTLAGTKPLPALQKMAAIASTVASLQVRSVKMDKRLLKILLRLTKQYLSVRLSILTPRKSTVSTKLVHLASRTSLILASKMRR